MKSSLHKFEYLDSLIGKKATGSPNELARKMDICERTVFEYIKTLKSMGAPIAYCKFRQSYYYTERGSFCFNFIKEI